MKLFASSREPEPPKHQYVRLLEYALANPSFKPEDACQACGLNHRDFRFVSPHIFELNARQDREFNPDEKQDWVLKPAAYFSYLQYVEFRHSIETAKRAYWLSVAAIVVSLAGVAMAIMLT